MTNYVKETDEEMCKSNRTYARIVASLSPEIALRYGHEAFVVDPLAQRLNEAITAQNWAPGGPHHCRTGKGQNSKPVESVDPRPYPTLAEMSPLSGRTIPILVRVRF